MVNNKVIEGLQFLLSINLRVSKNVHSNYEQIGFPSILLEFQTIILPICLKILMVKHFYMSIIVLITKVIHIYGSKVLNRT